VNRLAVASVSAVAVVGLAAPATASGSGYDGDLRHCVTAREVFIISGGLPRREVEQRWEAEDKGKRRMTLLGPAWTYDMCDRGPDWVAFVMFEPGHGSVVYGVTDVPTTRLP
jgi:hypothetical protein